MPRACKKSVPRTHQGNQQMRSHADLFVISTYSLSFSSVPAVNCGFHLLSPRSTYRSTISAIETLSSKTYHGCYRHAKMSPSVAVRDQIIGMKGIDMLFAHSINMHLPRKHWHLILHDQISTVQNVLVYYHGDGYNHKGRCCAGLI